MSRTETFPVLGFDLASVTLDEAAGLLLRAAGSPAGSTFVVTLNPEIVVRSQTDAELRAALQSADLTVADGVGVLWAARRAGYVLPGRVPGVDLVCRLMELGGSGLRVFFLGGKPGVAERAAAEAARRWGVIPAGHMHGYFDAQLEGADVAARVAQARPDLLLAGLGESQELFLARHREALGARVLVGVGGTLDVLAGEVRRTPEWTRRLNVEWAWRVGLDRSRWHRFPRLLDFVRLVLAAPRHG